MTVAVSGELSYVFSENWLLNIFRCWWVGRGGEEVWRKKHIVREPGGPTVHPPLGTFHYGSKMYLRVSQTQSHLFPGKPLGCTAVIALCARVPSSLQSVCVSMCSLISARHIDIQYSRFLYGRQDTKPIKEQYPLIYSI